MIPRNLTDYSPERAERVCRQSVRESRPEAPTPGGRGALWDLRQGVSESPVECHPKAEKPAENEDSQPGRASVCDLGE